MPFYFSTILHHPGEHSRSKQPSLKDNMPLTETFLGNDPTAYNWEVQIKADPATITKMHQLLLGDLHLPDTLVIQLTHLFDLGERGITDGIQLAGDMSEGRPEDENVGRYLANRGLVIIDHATSVIRLTSFGRMFYLFRLLVDPSTLSKDDSFVFRNALLKWCGVTNTEIRIFLEIKLVSGNPKTAQVVRQEDSRNLKIACDEHIGNKIIRLVNNPRDILTTAETIVFLKFVMANYSGGFDPTEQAWEYRRLVRLQLIKAVRPGFFPPLIEIAPLGRLVYLYHFAPTPPVYDTQEKPGAIELAAMKDEYLAAHHATQSSLWATHASGMCQVAIKNKPRR
jgi:hypothetical protein